MMPARCGTRLCLEPEKRKLIEEAFSWVKTIAGLARPMRRGMARMRFAFTFTMVAHDPVRLPRLLGAAAA